jgi:hypothetical protein
MESAGGRAHTGQPTRRAADNEARGVGVRNHQAS